MKLWGSWYFYFTHTFPFCWHFLLLLSEWLDCFIYTDLVPFLWTLFVSILLLLCVSWENCFPILFLDMPCYPRDKLLIFVLIIAFVNFRFSSVAQLCPTLCEPMNRSTPGLPVHHQLPEFTQAHIHRVSDASSHLILCHSLLLLPLIPPSIKVFSNESTRRMRWAKYWSFSFSIIPSKEIPRADFL